MSTKAISGRAPTLAEARRVSMRKLLWVGPLALIASIAANLIIRFIALLLFNVSPEFPPFFPGQIIFLTTISILVATIVFGIFARFSKHPVAWYRRIGIGVLLLSFVPDAGLLSQNMIPGTNTLSVGALVIMHIVTAAIVIGMFTTLTLEKE